MTSFQQTKIGGLDCLQRVAHESKPSLILLHGYGADCRDLAGLVPALSLPNDFNYFFPNAPLEAPYTAGGRAWFPIDMQKLELAMRSGEPRYFDDTVPGGMDTAARDNARFLKSLPVDLSKAAIGGFSQGSMVSSHAVIGHRLPSALLIQLSGAMAGHATLDPTSSLVKSVFQSHGRADSVLPFYGAQALAEWFVKNNFQHELIEFDGGHEIPLHVISALKTRILQQTTQAEVQDTISL